MSGELILVVDDEPNIVQLARMYLEQEGFKVASVGDGLTALKQVERKKPDLMVLDIMLPELDGLEVCRQLRYEDNSIPILMLTARDDDIDKILGLELGADDYMTKPFNPREMVARVKAILRRGAPSTDPSQEPIQISDLVIDPRSREVTIQGQFIDMRSQEFDLLHVLAKHQGLVMSRAQLLEKAWGYQYYGHSRTVDVHVGQLRKKISASAVKIITISGVGYKLVP